MSTEGEDSSVTRCQYLLKCRTHCAGIHLPREDDAREPVTLQQSLQPVDVRLHVVFAEFRWQEIQSGQKCLRLLVVIVTCESVGRTHNQCTFPHR